MSRATIKGLLRRFEGIVTTTTPIEVDDSHNLARNRQEDRVSKSLPPQWPLTVANGDILSPPKFASPDNIDPFSRDSGRAARKPPFICPSASC
jgi:hypothetical protein